MAYGNVIVSWLMFKCLDPVFIRMHFRFLLSAFSFWKWPRSSF